MSEAYTTLSAGLTTIFTPPASCSSSWTYEGEYFNALSDGLLMQNVLSNFDTRCWPASFTGNGRANGLSNVPIQIYSPGICPSGYTTAAGFTDSGTTTEICCLRNFAYYTEYSSQNYASDSIFYQGCTSIYPLISGPTVVQGRVYPTALNTTTVTGPLTMWAQPVYVEYQATDLALFSTTTTSPSPLPSSTAQPSSTISAPSSNTASVSPIPTIMHNSTLSTGAKAGIGVAAAAGGLLLIALLFFCMRWRRTSRSRTNPPAGAPNSPWGRKELGDSDPRRELEGSPFKDPRYSVARKPVAHAVTELE